MRPEESDEQPSSDKSRSGKFATETSSLGPLLQCVPVTEARAGQQDADHYQTHLRLVRCKTR